MSGNWLVFCEPLGPFQASHAYAYSFPDLQLESNVSLRGFCYITQAASDGQIYASCLNMVSVLEIGEKGDISVTQNLTAGGLLTGHGNNVAGFGSNPGQVWVCMEGYLDKEGFKFYLIETSNDSVIEVLKVSPRDLLHFNGLWVSTNAALLPSRELLLIACAQEDCVLLLHQSGSTSAINVTVSGYLMLSHNDHFLLLDRASNTILILDSKGELVHTVDDLNGKHGFWMQIQDVGYWKNNLIVLGRVGDIAIFSML